MSDSPIRTSESIANICASLVKAFAEMPGAPKDTKGQVGNQTRFYADLAAVVDVSRPVLAKHDLAYLQLPTGFRDGCLHLTTRIIHSSGEWIEGTSEMPISQAQAVGSAITYSKRYSLQGGLAMISEDDDGAAASKPTPPRHAPAPAPDAADQLVDRVTLAIAERVGMIDQLKKLSKENGGLAFSAEALRADPHWFALVKATVDA